PLQPGEAWRVQPNTARKELAGGREALDAVEELPVPRQRRAGAVEQRLRPLIRQPRRDQLPSLGGVAAVELGVDVEIGRSRAGLDPVEARQAIALGLGDRRLRGLDRVEDDE